MSAKKESSFPRTLLGGKNRTKGGIWGGVEEDQTSQETKKSHACGVAPSDQKKGGKEKGQSPHKYHEISDKGKSSDQTTTKS